MGMYALYGLPMRKRREEQSQLRKPQDYTPMPSLCCFPRNHPKVRGSPVEMVTILRWEGMMPLGGRHEALPFMAGTSRCIRGPEIHISRTI